MLSPPRHFLYPALLLLLSEEPRHGYLLVDALAALGLGRMDRPSVYRALADLEADGLVRSWDEAPTAGSTRHVHAVTAEGEAALDAWMSIVAQERTSLDLVLQRYWYCNSRRPWAAALHASSAVATPGASAGTDGPTVLGTGDADRGARQAPVRFEVRADRSSLVVQARSSVGPIAFSATSLAGSIEVVLHEGLVAKDTIPSARLEVRVADLTSGNAIYDGELLRRVDARRYPVVTVALRNLRSLGDGNCYRIDGDLTLHGVTHPVDGVVTATVHERRLRGFKVPEHLDRSMIVAGEQVLDIRHFEMAMPTMPLFKIYPDVRLRLHLEADQVRPDEAGRP